jgi:hypothetical protein
MRALTYRHVRNALSELDMRNGWEMLCTTDSGEAFESYGEVYLSVEWLDDNFVTLTVYTPYGIMWCTEMRTDGF